ncbi:lipid-A-disaccharide synthase [Caulobacter sp. KR2-114]|uniref:lipid-A-disaccharide synthase n=1 Tax=Caulobacter sp. KR2-114 TaxID=3400912 RepID=UPI003C0D50C5
MTARWCVMLVAAEASGDALGAGLARALKARLGDEVRFIGAGGRQMTEAGVASAFDFTPLSVVGLLEGLLAFPTVLARARDLADLARRERPDVAVLIDAWGFSWFAGQRIRRALPYLPLIKYVAPQVWATRPSRARALPRLFGQVLTLHAFEPPLFERWGAKATFVGNPVLARDLSAADPERLRNELGITADAPLLVVLPGSRASEVERLGPVFEDAVNRLKADRPDLQIIVPAAETVAPLVKSRVAGWPHRAFVVEGEAARFAAMRAADAALACSGTVTTELALAGCPMIVGYRLGHVTHFLARFIIRTPYITLVNIAAGREIAPEFIQDRCNGPALAQALAALLDDPAAAARQVAAQNAALDGMGRTMGDPADRAAEAVIAELGEQGLRRTPAG